MKSPMRMALTCMSILPLIGLGGCLSVGGKPIVIAPSATPCSSLVPDDWRQGVAGAAFPADDTQGSWVKFGDAQTAQLDKANDHTKSAISIVSKCEARDEAARKALTPRPWWKFWG